MFCIEQAGTWQPHCGAIPFWADCNTSSANTERDRGPGSAEVQCDAGQYLLSTIEAKWHSAAPLFALLLLLQEQ